MSEEIKNLFPLSQRVFVPALRNQAPSIQFYVNYFLAKGNLDYCRAVTGITPEAMSKLKDYPWPGGIAQLRDMVLQAMLFATDGKDLSLKSLPLRLQTFNQTALEVKRAVLLAEKDVIKRALEDTKNNKRRAAELLNISRKTLYLRLRRLAEIVEVG